MIVVAALARPRPSRWPRSPRPRRFNDLGNLLLAFIMLWAYMSFSQFLIIWSGNLAEEIPWYLRRSRGGWRSVASALIVFHFFVPFFAAAVPRDASGSRRLLAAVAGRSWRCSWSTCLARSCPAFAPAASRRRLEFWACRAGDCSGIGGLWVGGLPLAAEARPLVPRNDPRARGRPRAPRRRPTMSHGPGPTPTPRHDPTHAPTRAGGHETRDASVARHR